MIGITLSLVQILLFEFLKLFNKSSLYSLALCGIGFLYVGFTWTDTATFMITSVQAIVLFFISYLGLSLKNMYVLALGYFLHGLWHISFSLWQDSTLIPPDYDLFCMSLDFCVGIYLILRIIDLKVFTEIIN